ncbi:type III secretion system protein [Pantoea agglomerans]|uniref:type III secretion system protein n=1 Tax=Enterobacter agglomerans TaxID=549 RepID=UPI0013BD0FE1|nr:type III secretion system protein [Pantoea agglomerans]NEG59856.1 type III secretion system protein [Pantoea agglomerans]NEG98825.1 type III secretion system protein [Pantoea agglomerans]NEH05191.1 type III secretion system protein [Pantoea agglomerans]NEH16180.1 type III secretion system protein [Pantoea agglomerans]
MEAWRRGREFVRMLAQKQKILQVEVSKTESRINQITERLNKSRFDYEFINQQIKQATPAGVLAREEIYKALSKQGVLLNKQALIIQQLEALREELDQQEVLQRQQRNNMLMLDKKIHKLDCYLQPLRREYLRSRDNNAENEMQEVIGFGRENY